jgi:outer membrane receptor protein involved in Fe transport
MPSFSKRFKAMFWVRSRRALRRWLRRRGIRFTSPFDTVTVFRVASGVVLLATATVAAQQPVGSIRGSVRDADFSMPLVSAQVSIAETGEKCATTEDGTFVFGKVPPGSYTLLLAKDGYTRQVQPNVVVAPGQMTDVETAMTGEFTDMDEFIIKDLNLDGGTDAGLLTLRAESPAQMNSVSSSMISRAGASDAAAALKLVSGATVQDGKYAVVRGLPGRYVSSQMNGVRLPTADANKRAVQLDQYPAVLIQSIQVSKTFTPDQQGDASGGAVNLVLKGIPDETGVQFKAGTKYNTQVTGRDDFLTAKGDGMNFWGESTGSQARPIDGKSQGAVGVSRTESPIDSDWSLTAGGKKQGGDAKFGGLASLYYKRDSAFCDNGVNDKYWVKKRGDPMTPRYSQGTPEDENFKTSLFDVTTGSEKIQWGGLGALGVETEKHSLALLYMHTQVGENTAMLSEDTRGKAYFFPGYKVNNPDHPGNQNPQAAPYLRTEALEYTERTTDTLQVKGTHVLPTPEFKLGTFFGLLEPELDWTVAQSAAGFNSPNKRLFGSMWVPEHLESSWPPGSPPTSIPATYYPYKPAANFTMGNVQQVAKDINEDSGQFFINGKQPFEQWSGDRGYLKLGVFYDQVDRTYDQESFSNLNDNSSYEGKWNDYWSAAWPNQKHRMSPVNIDVDYTGKQKIFADYAMLDLPLCPYLNVIGGARYETTDLSIVNSPDKGVTWIDKGQEVVLKPGDADVAFKQKDVLPALELVIKPIKQIELRPSYSETVARQTFKELSPIQQTEYLGADVFIGNPELQMSAVKNYDLRLDYTPYEEGLVSVSWFRKDITDPIEYVQRYATNVGSYTTAVNYPEGTLTGYEIEARQKMEMFWDPLKGLTLGANATFIQATVTLPEDEIKKFALIKFPTDERDMMNTPEYLYNLFMMYDLDDKTQFSIFYTVQGDTLVAGAGAQGEYTPDVYAKEYGTLNLTVSRKLGKYCKLSFQAKNLLNPEIQEVYRSPYVDGDTVKTSYTKGIEFQISLGVEF